MTACSSDFASMPISKLKAATQAAEKPGATSSLPAELKRCTSGFPNALYRIDN